MRPRCSRFLSLLFLVTTIPSLHAQLGVYGKFDLTHDSSPNVAGTASGDSDTFYGGGIGIYDDFLHAGPVRLGLDLRGDFSSGGQYNYASYLGGVRVAFKTPILPLRPYAQASIGVGGPQATGPFAAGISSAPYNRKLTYEFLGGLDWTIFPHVDFRTIEVGVGRQSGISSGTPPPTATLVLVSTGLVARF